MGNCSAGGQHDHSGSGNYTLEQRFGGALPADRQDKLRWCKKCQVLAYSSIASTACAAGGIHDYSGSGNYVLAYEVGADTVLREAYFKALKPKAAAAAG